MQIGILLDKQGWCVLTDLLDLQVSNGIISYAEVILDEPHLSTISGKIDQLNQLGILNREFCIKLNQKIKEYCLPLSISDFISSDKYLKRSFYNNPEYKGRYAELIDCALNYAIFSNVNKSNIDQVTNILNS